MMDAIDDIIIPGKCYRCQALQTQLTAYQKELEMAKELAEEVMKARKEICLLGPMAFSKVYILAHQFLEKLKEEG